MKGYFTTRYCPKCDKYEKCYRNSEQEDTNAFWEILCGILTFGITLFISINEPYKYCYTCTKCGYTFYTEYL